jgi:MazG family protein
MTEPLGSLFERLLDIMARLRGPEGCPWDREQTRASLKPYLVEEAYEVLDAIDRGDLDHLREELGDLLLQVVFHAQVAAERDEFSMREVLAGLAAKLVHRHPHVFAGARVDTPERALAQWEAIKQAEAREAGRRRSVLDGVPRALPALLRAQRMQEKASRVRFDWPDAPAAWDKVEEELREAGEAVACGDRQRLGEELGDLMFALVNVARLSGIDAEGAVDAAVEKFRRRFTSMETALTAGGASLDAASTEDMERAWAAAKARERVERS